MAGCRKDVVGREVGTYSPIQNITALNANRGSDIEKVESTSSDYGTDSIKTYLKEIGNIPLLSTAEEFRLAIQKTNGDKEARERMVKANLRLVVSIAKHYGAVSDLPFFDLIQEGNIGLLKAADKYDCHRGVKFSSYATWWIQHSIICAIAEQSRAIRFPAKIGEAITKMNRVSRQLWADLGREPSEEEIADKVPMPVKSIRRLLLITRDTISLDAPVRDDEDAAIEDFIADEKQSNQTSDMELSALKEQMNAALGILSERDRKVLKLRFGMDSDHAKTLDEIGGELHLTHERIRQIELRALQKLRLSECSAKLREFLD